MSNEIKLDSGQKHILRLVSQEAIDGWATVSEELYPLILENIPERLVNLEKLKEGGRVKLTEEGESILNAMAWL